MHKVLVFITVVGIIGCTDEQQTEQVIIPQVQLKALDKVKNIEAELLKSQQKRADDYKEQGL